MWILRSPWSSGSRGLELPSDNQRQSPNLGTFSVET
jgi:hypothetical protein